ncbi:Rieske (2Fe-2S) protein [Actinoplanes cyaneus]|uniref:Rieske (2Fe-2S) protein n=1 Tax=Actinoplanes cyaneus TaxID=52696 RepID=UPI001943A42D|nr:Rieske (2Fe-2S) protein [Actinoplanes cyaneus]MCW2142403.1 Ferredoxin subunit of nitrite reductase or a ring-hydroxylating dioxygenase [Actinoplanes cyaneus]
MSGVDRRAAIGMAGVAGTGMLLAACGDSGSDSGSGSGGSATATTAGGGGTVITKASDVPVGGGVITGIYVVTQPEAGSYKAFSSVCTHQGCTVAEVTGKAIRCICHQSTFDITTGAPTGGPATKALAETAVKESDGNIVTA